jgi:anti-anti-sigma factor
MHRPCLPAGGGGRALLRTPPLTYSKAMRIDATSANGYRVLAIAEDLGLNSDLAQLRAAIDECLATGLVRIALRFTPKSFLSTRAIAVLVQCVERVNDHAGRLALLQPNADIRHCLQITRLDELFEVAEAEKDLGQLTPVK